jgi:phenylpyruvate tautomerase PptA (4-oxalocrotonate tautomerase family)
VPLLQFDTTLDLTPEERQSFTADVTELYADEMATTTGHVAVVLREQESAALSLGRAVDGPLLFLNADVRAGRSFERKRNFALATMDLARERFDVPRENLKVVFSEHAGEDMMGVDRVGGDWSEE